MEKIYYSPKGFCRGRTAIKKLAKEAKVSEKQALEFLKKQAVWQIYLPAPKKIIRPRFDVSTKDEVHQADLLFLFVCVEVLRPSQPNRAMSSAVS